MSWLSRILGRSRQAPVDQIAGVINRILERADDIADYRRALIEAAQAGDLDGPFETFRAANRRARDYIENG